MKKKRVLEADLDPPNTPRTRPGGETAKRALALSQRKPGDDSATSRKTRPGSYAAKRALANMRSTRREK